MLARELEESASFFNGFGRIYNAGISKVQNFDVYTSNVNSMDFCGSIVPACYRCACIKFKSSGLFLLYFCVLYNGTYFLGVRIFHVALLLMWWFSKSNYDYDRARLRMGCFLALPPPETYRKGPIATASASTETWAFELRSPDHHKTFSNGVCEAKIVIFNVTSNLKLFGIFSNVQFEISNSIHISQI